MIENAYLVFIDLNTVSSKKKKEKKKKKKKNFDLHTQAPKPTKKRVDKTKNLNVVFGSKNLICPQTSKFVRL